MKKIDLRKEDAPSQKKWQIGVRSVKCNRDENLNSSVDGDNTEKWWI